MGWLGGTAGRRRGRAAPAPHVLHLDQLVLRPLEVDDHDDHMATIDDEVRRWQGYDDLTIANLVPSLPFLNRPRSCPWAFVVCDPDGSVIGSDSFVPSDRQPNEVELGWWLGPTGRGRGLGTASLLAMLDYLYRHLDVRSVRMGTSTDNERARRQIEASGAVVTGEELRTLPNGETVISIWYRHINPRVTGDPLVEHGWAPPCRRRRRSS
jgi:RimJ/RimL family protein N-acetyltransferase